MTKYTTYNHLTHKWSTKAKLTTGKWAEVYSGYSRKTAYATLSAL